MARWISRPERVLRRAGAGIAVLALAELATLLAVSGRERLIMAGALVGACLSLAVVAFGILRLRHVVGAAEVPHPQAGVARSWVPAAMLEGFPMDQLRPALLADPDRLDLDLLYTAWTSAVLGRDAAWIQERFRLDPWVADLLVRAARASADS
ncbi:hypothetical protein [Streptacidiphilus melanogenes]|uniref:hypothetical protein n=1 Tax=Streptacidiphilus melanogenes TaxID=411235 RepID=UPI0005AA7392|nr:hypothetical protein [Streptacidiphilus melanogenes]